MNMNPGCPPLPDRGWDGVEQSTGPGREHFAQIMREIREDCIREWAQTIPGFNAERAMRRG